MSVPKWKKAGHRSVKRKGFPYVVVRFPKGALKFIEPDGENAYRTRERAAGRDPEQGIKTMIAEATAFWGSLVP